MASASPVLLRLWRDDGIRSNILSHLDKASMCALRLTDSECCELTTRTLFARTRLTFSPSALTRPSRLEALSRIGPYIEHLTFSFPHGPETFLPPLLNPQTGREVNFLYTPHTSPISVLQRPKYGSPELGDLLTQQYPPLFHAATNVPAFITAFTRLENLRHLTISCPGQDPAQRYRRDIVDYALISLRIAIERSPLHKLSKLSLHHIHPSGLQYLRHLPGYGCTPSSGRRWRQIRKLIITMDSWEFGCTGIDHLKILEDYIRGFSANLEKVSFGWNGRKGPCPFTLFTDPLFSPPRAQGKLFGEMTSPMSPLPTIPSRPPMTFPKLTYMQVRNATMSSEQVSSFVSSHSHTVKEFDFENVFLINGGSWDDALAPLMRRSQHGSEEWSSQQSGSELSFSSTENPSNEDFTRFMQESIEEVVDSFRTTPHHQHFATEKRDSVIVTKLQKKTKRVHRKRRRKANHPKTPGEPSKSKLVISAPIPIAPTQEDILLPQTTFNPKLHPPPLPPIDTALNPSIQGVQRNLSLEEVHDELANDPDKRVSALKKAREAVLSKLGREFCKSGGRGLLFKNTCSSVSSQGRRLGYESNSALVPLMFSRY